MTAAWIISEGSYSDYQVVCVVEEEEQANMLCARMNAGVKYGDWRVEEVPVVDNSISPVLSLKLEYWHANPHPHYGHPPWSKYTYPYDMESMTFHWPIASDLRFLPLCDYQPGMVWQPPHFTVEGTDHERVRKVYSEKKAELVAKLNGLTS